MDCDEALSSQIEYYRRRAAEYDETSVGDTQVDRRRYGRLVDNLGPAGDVLEIACGTGLWTQHLIRRAQTLTAIDSSPEMIDLAKSRVDDSTASLIIADVFAWQPEQRFDSVFFGFWLSHVPPQRFNAFWELLDRCLAPRGRVLFVDEGAPRAALEHLDRCLASPKAEVSVDESSPQFSIKRVAESPPAPIVKRRLRDGTIHDVVKIFYDPDDLVGDLRAMGWSAEVELTPDGLLAGTVRRS